MLTPWVAGLNGALGLDCIYRDLLAIVHQGCDWLTPGGARLAFGDTGHSSRGSFPMQAHRLLANLPHTHREPPRANASPSPGGSR